MNILQPRTIPKSKSKVKVIRFEKVNQLSKKHNERYNLFKRILTVLFIAFGKSDFEQIAVGQ